MDPLGLVVFVVLCLLSGTFYSVKTFHVGFTKLSLLHNLLNLPHRKDSLTNMLLKSKKKTLIGGSFRSFGQKSAVLWLL